MQLSQAVRQPAKMTLDSRAGRTKVGNDCHILVMVIPQRYRVSIEQVGKASGTALLHSDMITLFPGVTTFQTKTVGKVSYLETSTIAT